MWIVVLLFSCFIPTVALFCFFILGMMWCSRVFRYFGAFWFSLRVPFLNTPSFVLLYVECPYAVGYFKLGCFLLRPFV